MSRGTKVALIRTGKF